MLEPARRTQQRVGETSITFVPDGEVRLEPTVLFPGTGAGDWGLYATYLDADGRLPVSVGTFLVRTPDHNVLIDLGLGAVDFEVPDVASFRGGEMIEGLRAEGLDVQDVDAVVFTHLHHDHVGWTSNVAPAPNAAAGQTVTGLTFANARHLVHRAEWDHWKGTAEIVGPDPDAVQQPLAAVLEFVADGQQVVPGVEVRSTPGHTPGHLSVVVSDPSTSWRLVVLGDVMHTQAQVGEPDWSFLFDVDPAGGVRTRRAVLEEYSDGRTVIAGGHFAGTVFGEVLPPLAKHGWRADRNAAVGV
jgi:glyoxylase-like metal-dependent hydrolase (beta-lactamase superfamily II)